MAKTEKISSVSSFLLSNGVSPEKIAELESKPVSAVESEFKGKAVLKIGTGWAMTFGGAKAELILTHLPEIIAFYMANRGEVREPEDKELQKKIKAYIKLVGCTEEEATIWAKGTFSK